MREAMLMLCSKCGTTIRPVVAVDIDGTLGDYHGHFFRFAKGYLGRDVPDIAAYHGQCEFKEWFCAVFSCDIRTFRDCKLAYRQGGLKRNMPKFPGASAFIRALRRDAEVWLTTTRPYLRLDNVDPDTREWLDRSRIHYDGLLYDEDKYTVLAERVDPARVVAVVDDLPEQYDAAAVVFGDHVPLMIERDHNKEVHRRNKVRDRDFTWSSEDIRKRIDLWRVQYAS